MLKYVSISLICLFSSQVSAVTLQEALISAYNNNDDLKTNRREFLISIEQFPQALSEFLPSINATLDSTKSKQKSKSRFGDGSSSTEVNSFQKNIVLDQPIFDGGSGIASLKRAQSGFRSARAQFYHNEQQIFLKAIDAYLTCYETKEKYDISETSVKANQKQLEATQERYNVGEIKLTDVASAKSALALAETKKLSAYASLQNAKANFIRVFGIEPVDITLPEIPKELPASFEEFKEKSLRSNQEIETAKHIITSYKANEVIAKSGLLPQVRFRVQGGKSYYDPEFSGSSSAQNSIGVSSTLSVTIPILPKGGVVYSDIRKSKLSTRNQVIKFEAKIKEVSANCINYWEGYNTAKSRIVSATEGVEAGQVAYDGAVQEQLVGTNTIVDVLAAEDKLNQNKIEKVEANKESILAAYQIKTLTGQLTAKSLRLNVNYFSPEKEFDKVKTKIIGF